MNISELREKLKILGFTRSSRNFFKYVINGHSIGVELNEIDASKSKIDYERIKVWNRSSSGFHQEETFVILECVIRLLRKGYSPENIELEKTWKTGRGTSGRLDSVRTKTLILR